MTFSNLLDRTIKYSFYLLFFLVPLIFTSVNFELFEYNKMILTYSLTVIIASLWITKMIIAKEFRIQKTPFDLPIVLYLLSSFLSTIESIDIHTSLWGYYSRSHGGLLSTLSYIVLYYAYVTNLACSEHSENSERQRNQGYRKIGKSDSLKHRYTEYSEYSENNKSLYILLFSAFLVTFYGILERFGIDANFWVQDVKNRVFSTLGQPNWLSAFIDALIFIPLALALTSKSKSKKAIYYILYTIYFLCLLFTNSKSGILAFFLGLAVFSLLTLLRPGLNIRRPGLSMATVWLGSLLTFLLLGQNTYKSLNKFNFWLKTFSNKNTNNLKLTTKNQPPLAYSDMIISESSEIRKVVWKGAIKVWQHYPIFGSGLETFAYSYYNFRPAEHNLLSEWDFLYNKAHNEFVNILACQGTLGILSYLILIGAFISWSLRKLITHLPAGKAGYSLLIAALLSGYLTIIITDFFGFSVVVIGLLLYLIPALSLDISQALDSKKCLVWKFETNLKPLAILPLGVGAYFIFSLVQMWRADFYFAKAEKEYSSGYVINSFVDLQKAVRLNLREPLYHSYLAQASGRLALAYFQADATGSAEMINQLSALAESEAEISVTQNPVHTSYWRSAATTYNYLAEITPAFRSKAIQSILSAVKLAPTDPRNFSTLAILYNEQKDYNQVEINLKKAVELKPNYRNARIQLAMLYDKLSEKDKAREQVMFILNQIDNTDEFSINWLKNDKIIP